MADETNVSLKPIFFVQQEALYLAVSNPLPIRIDLRVKLVIPNRLVINLDQTPIARELPANAERVVVGAWNLNLLADDAHFESLKEKPIKAFVSSTAAGVSDEFTETTWRQLLAKPD